MLHSPVMTTSIVDHQTEFAVSFEGPTFVDHTMEVRDLAPALLALGQAFDRANGLLNGDRASVSLSIRATRPGSFELVLLLEQVFEGAGDILTGDLFTSAANLTQLMIGTPFLGVGLINLVKRLRGRKPNVGPQQPEGVVFEAEHIRIFVPTEVARLYSDKPVRDQFEEFVRPLGKEGVERVVFRRDQTELESIRREEAEYFKASAESTNKTEHIIPSQNLQLTSLVFGKRGKWRLSDGANVHWYAMEDQDFATAIQQGKRFGKNDILVCEVLLTQWLDDTSKLTLEYSVMRVLQHITPGEQMPLPSTDLN